MNENISAPENNSDAAMLGEVILLSRKVENKLHTICGETEVAGIQKSYARGVDSGIKALNKSRDVKF